MKYGWITKQDADIIKKHLILLRQKFEPLIALEIGTYLGETTRFVSQYAQTTYTIDNDSQTPELQDSNIKQFIGDSAEYTIHTRIPAPLHFVFIDGCHCKTHVEADFTNFSPKVVIGGIMIFHDIQPSIQTQKTRVELRIEVKNTLKKIIPNSWDLIEEEYSNESPHGGCAVYRRLS